jgi:hypothetical protein
VVPAHWRARGSALARRLLTQAQSGNRNLKSFRIIETLSGGPGSFVRILYRIKAPNRFTYSTSAGGQSVTIGRRQWTRSGPEPWSKNAFGGGIGFRSRDLSRWTPYASVSRLLAVKGRGAHRIAELALMEPAAPPVWFRLRIGLGQRRVLADQMTTQGHFMARRYRGFNQPLRITPPVPVGSGR